MEFKIAQTQAEKKAVFQLRYAVYVKEMQVYVSKADHESKQFTDERDQTDRLLYAKEEDELAAAISVVVGADAPMTDDVRGIYDLPRFSSVIPESKMGIAMRLVSKPQYRSSTVPFKIMAEAVRIMVDAGVEVLFCTCQPHLLNMYQRLGFRSYSQEVFNDPEFGIMIPLVLLMGDWDHLKKVRSPLYRTIAQGTYDQILIEPILEVMGDITVHNSTSEEGAVEWSYFSDVLSSPTTNRPLLFEGLVEAEIQQVIASGYVIDCKTGDLVIKKGQVAQTVYVPLEGTLEVRNGSQLIAVVQTGEMLGEQAFLLGSRRSADVFAGSEGARVLSLNDRNLRKLIEKPERIAAILLLNISRSLALRLSQTTAELQALAVPVEDAG